jgi:hypothetical protein
MMEEDATFGTTVGILAFGALVILLLPVTRCALIPLAAFADATATVIACF